MRDTIGFKILRTVVIIVLGLFVALPLFVMISSSLKPLKDVQGDFTWWPTSLTASPFFDMWKTVPLGRYFVNAPGGNLVDDHVYVIRGLRIPCLDIVNYAPDRSTGFGAYWHTGGDTMDNIDRATLRAVGQTVLYVIKGS